MTSKWVTRWGLSTNQLGMSWIANFSQESPTSFFKVNFWFPKWFCHVLSPEKGHGYGSKRGRFEEPGVGFLVFSWCSLGDTSISAVLKDTKNPRFALWWRRIRLQNVWVMVVSSSWWWVMGVQFARGWSCWKPYPETNIAPENGWLEYYFPIGEAYFQGRTVSFREGNNQPGNQDLERNTTLSSDQLTLVNFVVI